mmetsp:Transcript_4053/g.8693  ORF Transcript_4053/g.8693 Transcript_4053/m.8693 type:complete len:134 (+) Transcript_4053:1303-1704(+)
MVGFNLIALGAVFHKLVEHLVEVIGIQQNMALRAVEIQTGSAPRCGKRHASKPLTDARASRMAIIEELLRELFCRFERKQGVQGGALAWRADLKHVPILSLPALAKAENQQLAAAADAPTKSMNELPVHEYRS